MAQILHEAKNIILRGELMRATPDTKEEIKQVHQALTKINTVVDGQLKAVKW